jgi:hypothetical protein
MQGPVPGLLQVIEHLPDLTRELRTPTERKKDIIEARITGWQYAMRRRDFLASNSANVRILASAEGASSRK